MNNNNLDQKLTDERVKDILRQAIELASGVECSTNYEDVMGSDVIALARDVLALREALRQSAVDRDAAIQERDTEREAIAAWIKPRPNEVDWPTEILLLATINSIRRGDHRNPEKIKGEKP